MTRGNIRTLIGPILFSYLIPCVAPQLTDECQLFCIQWDMFSVNDLEIVSQPQIPCPSWIHEDTIELLEADPGSLKAGNCHWISLCNPECDTTVVLAEICGPSITPQNAHAKCIANIKDGGNVPPSDPDPDPDPEPEPEPEEPEPDPEPEPEEPEPDPEPEPEPEPEPKPKPTTTAPATTTAAPTTTVNEPPPESTVKTLPTSTPEPAGPDECTPVTPIATLGDGVALDLKSNLADAYREAWKLSNAAYGDFKKGENIPGTSFTFSDYLDPNVLDDSSGYIALDDDPKNPRIVVSIRGSSTIWDWFTNLNVRKFDQFVDFFMSFDDSNADAIPEFANCENCFLHPGFLDRAKPVLEYATPILQGYIDENPCRKILVTAHSLGGAVGEILATAWAQKKGMDVSLITFAGPRAGSVEWSGFVDRTFENGKKSARFTHAGDLVPHVPFQSMVRRNYRHFTNELWAITEYSPIESIFGCSGPEDIDCSASQEPALQAKLALILTSGAFGLAVRSASSRASAAVLKYAKELCTEIGMAHGMQTGYAF